MNWIKNNWLKLGFGVIILLVVFLAKERRNDTQSYVYTQITANQLYNENCRKGIPSINPGHRLVDEMSFCIAELKKVDDRGSYPNPEGHIFKVALGDYQIGIKDTTFLESGIIISIFKDGKLIVSDDNYEPFEKDSEYPDYMYEIWETKTGLGDKVIAVISSRGGSWRGSEQLKAIYVDRNTGGVTITPSIIISDDLSLAMASENQEDYKNAIAKEISSLMRLQLKNIK
jgi:hypothetical protein